MDSDITRLQARFSGPRAFRVKLSANDRRIFPWKEPSPTSPNFWKISISPLNVLECLNEEPAIPEDRIREIHGEVIEFTARELVKPVVCNDLRLDKLSLTSRSFEVLMDSVGRSQNLQKLFLWGCDLGDHRGLFLEAAFSQNSRIKLLDLTDCNVGDEGAVGIGKALRLNTTLRKLNLSRNKIRNKGAIEIGISLGENSTLFNLILSENLIEAEGAAEIAKQLKRNTTLGFLIMRGNILRVPGASALADMIKVNRGLMEIDLGFCYIGENGLVDLWESLQYNDTLFKVEILEGNIPVGDIGEMKKNVAKRIEQNKLQQKRLFFEALKLNKSGAWGRTRLLFIGQGKAGKTATVRALLNEPFKEFHDSTVGADLKQLSTRSDKESGWAEQQQADFTSRHAARILAEKHFELLLADSASENKPSFEQPKRKQEGQTKTSPYRKVSSVMKIPVAADFLAATRSPQIRRRYSLPGVAGVAPKQREKRNLPEGVGDLTSSTFNIDEYMKAPFEQTMAFRSRHDQEALNFTLWDFGGQDVFYTMHHLFMSSHGLYFLVFNCLEILAASRGEFEINAEHPKRYLQFWLNSVAIHAPKTSVLLVGTHIDELEAETKDLSDINEYLVSLIQSKQDLVKIVENQEDAFCFFPVSNKSLVGIHQLQVMIEREARSQGHVEQEVPIRWMACLDKLMEETKSVTEPKTATVRKGAEVLSIAEVRLLAQRFEIVSQSEVEEMLTLFNELGVLIYLSSSEALKQKVILKPQWLLRVLGKIIRDSKIHVNTKEFEDVHLLEDSKLGFEQGLFSEDLIEYLWIGEDSNFLIELMKHAMLLCDWDFTQDDVKYFLVPSLLKKQSNSSLLDSNLAKNIAKSANSVKYECCFDFSAKYLPIGIFERILCLTVSVETLEFLMASSDTVSKVRDIQIPVVLKDFCSVSLTSSNSLNLVLTQDFEKLKIHLRIEGKKDIFLKNSAVASKAFKLVKFALEKVNQEVMSSGLEWKTIFVNEIGELSVEEAISSQMYPWFHAAEEQAVLVEDNLFFEDI